MPFPDLDGTENRARIYSDINAFNGKSIPSLGILKDKSFAGPLATKEYCEWNIASGHKHAIFWPI